MDCIEKERKRSDYKDAVEADHEEIRKGNYNFKGIGYEVFRFDMNILREA